MININLKFDNKTQMGEKFRRSQNLDLFAAIFSAGWGAALLLSLPDG